MLAVSQAASSADPRSLRFRHLTNDDGLSQSFVFAIAQDSEGYMWFGTQEGLNRFDGHTFTVFGPDAGDPGSISDESIRSIIEDRRGRLWIGTDAGGVSMFDGVEETFTNYLHDPDDDGSISDNRVRVLFADRDGFVWAGTDGEGLNRLDPDSGRFDRFAHDPTDPASLSGRHVWSIAQRDDGSIWVGTDGGLSRLNADGSSFTNFLHQPDDPSSLSESWVRVLLASADGALWIGTDAGGLNRLAPDSESFERFVHRPGDPTTLSDNRVYSLLQDEAGVLWVGTGRGLNAWDPDSRSFNAYFHDGNDRYSLNHDAILALHQDRGNVLWVGTFNGLSRWNQATRAMLHYRVDENDPNGLRENTITSFAEDADGGIWVGTFGGGLSRLDRSTGQFRTLRHDPEDPATIASDRVMSLQIDSQGALWAGTRNSGVSRLDAGGEGFVHYRHRPDEPHSLSADGVTDVLEHSDGTLWVATFGGGLNRYDGATDSFLHFRHDPEEPGSLSSDRLLVLFEDSDGAIWAGTYGAGLNRFDPKTGLAKRVLADSARRDGLGGEEVFMIQEDADKNLWIGIKARGLYCWSYADRQRGHTRFRRFTEADGLPSRTIYSGIWDAAENLWLSTDRGLSRFDPLRQAFRNYTVGHGLQGAEFNLAAGLATRDGELFFGGPNGFNAFRPDALVDNRTAPVAAITRLTSMNVPINIGRYGEDTAVELDHEQRVLSFEFAALDYAAPEQNRFSYRLEGLDEDWTDAGTERRVTYTNLRPGSYAFEVRAMNNDGVWSERATTLPLQVHPAPWVTWQAYALYIIVLASAALFWLRAQRQQLAVERQYTANLQWVETRLSEAQRIGGVGNWDWDIENDSLWWSEEANRLFNAEPGAWVSRGEALLDRVHPDDRETFEAALHATLAQQERLSMDHRIVRPDGSVRVVHQQAEVKYDERQRAIRVAGTTNDVTDRKRAEDDIRRRASFQTLLAETSSELIRARSSDFTERLESVLGMMADRYALDEISILWPPQADKEPEALHRWSRDDGGALRLASYPWLAASGCGGQTIVVEHVDDIPDSAETDRYSFAQDGIQSLLALPLSIDDKPTGSILFACKRTSRSWPHETVSELELLAANVTNAIARSRAVAEVRRLKNLLQEENVFLREEVRLAHGFDEIIGESEKLKSCLRAVEKVAPTDVPVLVLGETGTGKELIARAVYRLSKRCEGPFVSVNCPALPANLIESELFGHEKGAFTGALSRRKGRFELANGGTLFLDEIGDLPLELQAKLLRVLQTGHFERLGGSETLFSDVRLIAATNRDLKQAVERGEFRADLLYRIQTFPIRLPPLRARPEDVSLLTQHFVQKHAERLGKHFDTISAQTLRELERYSWPGNVRELEGLIERAMISLESNSVLKLSLPARAAPAAETPPPGSQPPYEIVNISEFERNHIVKVLEKTNWKISGNNSASTLLGIPASTLRSKMKHLGIERRPD